MQKKYVWVLLFTCLIANLILGVTVVVLSYNVLVLERTIERFDMFYTQNFKGEPPNGIVNGVYYQGEQFACIWMNRTWSAVMETCSHEYLHYQYDGHFT